MAVKRQRQSGVECSSTLVALERQASLSAKVALMPSRAILDSPVQFRPTGAGIPALPACESFSNSTSAFRS